MSKTHKVVRGNSFAIKVPLLMSDDNGVASPFSVAGWTFKFSVKCPPVADADEGIVKTTAAGEIVAIDEYNVVINGVAEDTKERAVGKYEYDIEARLGSQVHTLEKGIFEIEQEVTTIT